MRSIEYFKEHAAPERIRASNIIVKVASGTFLKYRNVTRLRAFIEFIQREHGKWFYMNVYDSKTKEQYMSVTACNVHLSSKGS